MKKGNNIFDKETFNFIKGLAVILLFFHHFFTFPEFYLPKFYYPELQFYAKYFQFSSNLCVAMFAFLTGYGFCFSDNKSFDHFLIKAKKILIVYWFLYFILFFFAVGVGLYVINYKEAILEFFGFRDNSVDGDIITFFWYMPFYLAVLFILTATYSVFSKLKSVFITDVIIFAIIPVFLFSFLCNLASSCFWIKRFFVDLELWFPSVIIGFITAKYGLFQLLDDAFCNTFKKPFVTSLFIPSALVASIFYGMYKLPGIIYNLHGFVFSPIVWNMSTCYILFLVYSGAKFYEQLRNKSIRYIIKEFGKYSLYMWLIHGIFFNVFKYYTQPILFFPKYPLLIMLWGLGICLFLSKVLEAAIKKANYYKNRLL